MSRLSTACGGCESSHLGWGRQEPLEVAELDDPVPDCTLVEPEVAAELPVLDVLLDWLVLLEVLVDWLVVPVVAWVAMTVPSAPALTMPSPARMAVRRRAVRRPVSRMFMGCPFVGGAPA